MFFLTYLRRELRRRMRQAVFIALGLALGIGLVITVIGAASGVKAAQAKVLQALYGIGTDVTVTTKPQQPAGVKPTSGNATSGGPGAGGGAPRAEICLNGKCYTSGTVDALVLGDTGALSAAEVAQIARLHDVSAAAGGLVLTDNRVVLPSAANPDIQPPTSFTVDGTDISHPQPRPAQQRPADQRPDLHRRRRRRRRGPGRRRLRGRPRPQGRLHDRHRRDQVHGHRHRQPARRPAARRTCTSRWPAPRR